MTPVLFSFRSSLSAEALSGALERVRSLPQVERAGWLFPDARSGESAGTLVAVTGTGFEAGDLIAALTALPEVEDASVSAERALVDG